MTLIKTIILNLLRKRDALALCSSGKAFDSDLFFSKLSESSAFAYFGCARIFGYKFCWLGEKWRRKEWKVRCPLTNAFIPSFILHPAQCIPLSSLSFSSIFNHFAPPVSLLLFRSSRSPFSDFWASTHTRAPHFYLAIYRYF